MSLTSRNSLLAAFSILFLFTAVSVGHAQEKGDDWEKDEWEEDAAEREEAKSDDSESADDAVSETPAVKKKAKPKKAKKTLAPVEDDDALPLRLGVSIGLLLESGAVRDDERVDVLRENNDFDYDVGLDPSVMIQLWMPLSEIFAVSTGLRYGGAYEGSTGDDDDDVFRFGHQLEAHLGLEAWIEILTALQVVVGVRGGVGVLFPENELDAEIQRLQDLGANAWSTPRLGMLITPLVGARWQIADAVAVRGDVAVSFGRYFLYNSGANVSGVAYERSAVANFTRYEFSAGIEFSL